jgi:hypothetical protein
MGYRPRHKVFKLVFADPEMDGLIVRVRAIRIGEMRELLDLADLDTSYLQPGDAGKASRMFEMFADALISWNVEDDQGSPVPATLEGISAQDGDFIQAIVKEWLNIFKVAGPLGNGSSDGGRSLEESLATASQSQSHPS